MRNSRNEYQLIRILHLIVTTVGLPCNSYERKRDNEKETDVGQSATYKYLTTSGNRETTFDENYKLFLGS